jgi:APA family basic amino acid/polyamine antiporter
VALAASATPAADVMRVAFGDPGAFIVGAAIATSTLGYISTAILLAPRIYFQMAADGFFFKGIAWISPKTHVPVYAILLHGSITAIIAASGTYEQIIKFITIWPWIFIALCAYAVFIYRKQDAGKERPAFTVPLHPWSTLLLIATILGIVIAVVLQSPLNALYGALIMLAGVLFYIWRRFATNASATDTPS